MSLVRPLVALLADPLDPFRPKWKLLGAASTPITASDTSAPPTYTAARTSQRQAASTASPSSSAARLDCEKLVTSPASSHARTAAHTYTVRVFCARIATPITAIITSARRRP